MGKKLLPYYQLHETRKECIVRVAIPFSTFLVKETFFVDPIRSSVIGSGVIITDLYASTPLTSHSTGFSWSKVLLHSLSLPSNKHNIMH